MAVVAAAVAVNVAAGGAGRWHRASAACRSTTTTPVTAATDGAADGVLPLGPEAGHQTIADGALDSSAEPRHGSDCWPELLPDRSWERLRVPSTTESCWSGQVAVRRVVAVGGLRGSFLATTNSTLVVGVVGKG